MENCRWAFKDRENLWASREWMTGLVANNIKGQLLVILPKRSSA